MDYTLMIIAKGGSGESMTSQLKSFPTKALADRVADQIEADAKKSTNRIEVFRLYLKDAS